MAKSSVSLDDKYDLTKDRIFISGTQALIRMLLMQKQRDMAAGLNTGGYVSGYRGSPLGQVDMQMARAKTALDAADVIFQPGLNEDLAATAIWGTQQAELRGEGKFDGVFGMWYGKGPGVDRSGDVLRHANLAGSSPNGGVVVLMGDDHISESSTTSHQSDYAMMDAHIPFLYPSGVQEIIDYGIYGWALSRFSGCWTGLKLIKDTVDTTASVMVDPNRLNIHLPNVPKPEGGLHIRLFEWPLEAEARLQDFKLPAVYEFVHANKLNKTIFAGGTNPKIGVVTTGKSYLDVRQGLEDIGIDEVKAAEMGLALYKVAMPWPLEPEGIKAFARGLDKIIVVEEKRSLIEWQIKEILYDQANAPMVIGKKDEKARSLFPAKDALDTNNIAIAIGERMLSTCEDELLSTRMNDIKGLAAMLGNAEPIATRTPYFCSGCPHNSSTRVPEGSRAYAGIGCHWMAQLMPDRNTIGNTHMGGEGANWIGENHFVTTDHVFQNLGDGTYNHSGILAIRAAIASNTTVTYKILYNDAVAMTGGQKNEGDLTPDDIVSQMLAEGAAKVVVVSDEPEKYESGYFPSDVEIHHRDELDPVQLDLRQIEGVSVMVYDQTCASEKRRRRKRGAHPDPAKRIFINDLVCEGCGDCGVKSNCVSVSPLETEFGRKRKIDQSSCNKDYSCVKGFCPSFVTVYGGELRKGQASDADHGQMPALPEPVSAPIDRQYNIVVTGIGGTGVVTIGALIGMASHLEGKGCGVLDMQGLAQKGGAVLSHIRIAETREQIQTIRVSSGAANLILGCDIVVAGSPKTLATMREGRTHAVINTQKTMTGDFTRQPDFDLPTERLKKQIAASCGEENADFVSATEMATSLMGNSIMSNLFMLGFVCQRGLLPISHGSIEEAIRLNNVSVEMNLKAFEWGRRAAHDPAAVEALVQPAAKASGSLKISETLDEVIDRRVEFLTAYQSKPYARRYRTLVNKMREAEEGIYKSGLTDAVARGLFKLMSYKDEYEVARLYTDGQFGAKVAEQFEGDYALKYNLAPPLLAKRDSEGHLVKKEYGPGMMRWFRLLAKMKRLRGTPLDLFGRTGERKTERALITDYEATVLEIIEDLAPENHAAAIDLAHIPDQIRGFGHVKEASLEIARENWALLSQRFRDPSAPVKEAAE